MSFSLYSFLMAVLWSGAFILLLWSARRSKRFVLGFGVWPLLIMIVFTVGRCFLPVEILSFTQVIQDEGVFAQINRGFLEPMWDQGPSPAGLLLLIWCAGSMTALTDCVIQYNQARRKYISLEPVDEDDMIYQVAAEQSERLGVERPTVIVTRSAQTPMLFGFLRPFVILPPYAYTREDYERIFSHEFTHWKNHDLWVKLLMEALRILFWWNPLVYLLRKDLSQTLELKCDITMIQEMSVEERLRYAETIQKTIGFAASAREAESPFLVAEMAKGDEKAILQRVRAILFYESRPRRQRITAIITFVVMSCLMVLSYSFILQPGYYDFPEEDFSGEGLVEETLDNTYLVRGSDGKYSLFVDDVFIQTINDEDASIMIEQGFPVKEAEGE